MIVTCPSCSTRYTLQPIALGGAGRRVRCSKCGQDWVQPPPTEAEANPKPSPKAKPGAKPKAKPVPAFDTPTLAPPTNPNSSPFASPFSGVDSNPTFGAALHEATEWIPDAGSSSATGGGAGTGADARPTRFPSFGVGHDATGRDALGHDDLDEDSFGYDHPFGAESEEQSWRTRQGLWAKLKKASRWVAFAVVVGAVAVMTVMNRDALVGLWPPAARFYEAIGLPVDVSGAGLQLQSVKSEQRVEDGAAMLVVEGQIFNASDQEREVPPLLAMSIGPDHQPVHKWRIPVTQSHLAPGSIATFRSVERDPGIVSEVAVTFDDGT